MSVLQEGMSELVVARGVRPNYSLRRKKRSIRAVSRRVV